MTNLDYAKVIGRFALTAADASDLDDDPETIYCSQGTVRFIPLDTYTKVAGATPMPFTAGHGVIDAQISGETYVDPTGGGFDGPGHLTLNGKPFVSVIDLTSSKVNPSIGPDKATHRVQFLNVKAKLEDDTLVDVGFETTTVRLTKDGDGVTGGGLNDLTILMPVPTGEASPIFTGPRGIGVASSSINTDGELLFEMTDGTEQNAGEIPVTATALDAAATATEKAADASGFADTALDAAANADSSADLAVDAHAGAETAKTGAENARDAALTAAQVWQASTAVTAGMVRLAPDGSRIKSTTNRTTRATFDATEEGFWTSIAADPTTVDGKALSASTADAIAGEADSGLTPQAAVDQRAGLAADAAAGVATERTSWVEAHAVDRSTPPPFPDMPTITFANSSTTVLSSPVEYRPQKVGIGANTASWDGQSDPVIRFPLLDYATGNGGNNDYGLYGKTKPGGGAQAARWQLDASVVTDATTDTVEITGYSLSQRIAFNLEINGRYVSEIALRTPASNDWGMKLVFPTAAQRVIRLVGGGDIGLHAFRVPTGKTLTKPAAPVRRVAIIGDSFANGSGNSDDYPYRGAGMLDTYAPRLARLLRADETIMAGIGGTGFTAGMDGATPNPYSTRVAAVLATNPRVLIVNGSINDGANGLNTATLQAAVESFLASVATVPEVYVLGTLLQSYSQNHDAVKAGVAAAGVGTFIDMKDFVYGTGKVSAPTGDGNADFFKMADGSHPTLGGHKAIARAAFEKIAAAVA